MSNSKEPKVTGIGGIFFFSDNVQKTKDWYSKNLGFNTDQWGATFASRNINKPDEVNYFQWSPFQSDTKYFEPSKKEFMINYRVQNLDALLVKLKENKVEILGEIQSYDYGRFAHIIDLEGNKIELWEPIDDELVK